MNYTKINQYMKQHDFLQADKQKVYNYIEQHNRTHNKAFQFINGELTRKELILTERNGSTAQQI